MSIASEIQNYADGLSDAYDAVNDMSGVIPQDKNMNNLDTAIRTIPVGAAPNDGVLTITQNGVTVQTFSANQSTNVTAALTDTTYSDFTGATSQQAGAHGLVTAPAAGDEGKFLQGDGTWATPTDTTYTAGTNVQISAQNVISATDTTYSDFTGATSSVAGTHGLVPAPTTSDPDKFLKGDGTWAKPEAELVEMAYGESNAWAKFIAAYTGKKIVYCRASSNANPGTGAKTRKAFMAYVNNEDNPTSVEFQYVRSNSSKSDSSQCDQVFVYTLKNTSGGTWSVATRDMAPKILVDTTLSKTFSGGANASVTLGAKAMTGATSGTAGTAGYVPAPAAGDESKFLQGDGTWATVSGGGATLSMQDWNALFTPSVVPTTDFVISSVTGPGSPSIVTDSDCDYNLFNAMASSSYTISLTRTPPNASDTVSVTVAMNDSAGDESNYIDNIVISGNDISFDTLLGVGWYPVRYIIMTITCGSISKTLKILANY